ncbi:MAG: hypothetical protein C4331_06140 [Meiothermus sp.]
MSADRIEVLLRESDALKAQLQALGPLPEPVLGQIREDLEVLHTYHSNAIEGNTLTLGETKAVLLEGITVAGKRLQEHLEAVNHREAMRLMMRLAPVKKPLEESEILELHSRASNPRMPGVTAASASEWQAQCGFSPTRSRFPR